MTSGPQGNRGDKGDKGEKGDSGRNGINGIDGKCGPQGFTGFIGPQGNTGRDGIEGKQGERGIIGPPGNQGNDGKPGINGIQGIEGRRGHTGSTGPTGSIGIGIQGKQGIIGPQGAQGNIGPDGKSLKINVFYDNITDMLNDNNRGEYHSGEIALLKTNDESSIHIWRPKIMSNIMNMNKQKGNWQFSFHWDKSICIGITGATGIGVTGPVGPVNTNVPYLINEGELFQVGNSNFINNINVNGTLHSKLHVGNSHWIISDPTSFEIVNQLETDTEKLHLLNPITYRHKTESLLSSSLSSSSSLNSISSPNSISNPTSSSIASTLSSYEREGIGYNANEMLSILPDLVKSVNIGNTTKYAIDYQGLLVVAIEELKKLQLQINEIKAQMKS